MFKLLKILLACAVIVTCVIVSWVPLQNVRQDLIAYYFPCQFPIRYSIGSFDPRFNISQSDFLKDVAVAEGIWESYAKRDLFVSASSTVSTTSTTASSTSPFTLTSSDLKINLIYDYRQDATNKLQKLGMTIDASQASYNALRTKYQSLQVDYAEKKTAFDRLVAAYKASGSTSAEAYAKIQSAQRDINTEVDTINSLVVVLNDLGTQLNKQVSQFNVIGKSTGAEFDEALYTEDETGNQINVYQYSTNDKLIRVLAHELGHALGFMHTDNQNDIMYKLNQSKNIVPTGNDIAQLQAKCNIK